VAWCGGGSRELSIVGKNEGANIGHGGKDTKLVMGRLVGAVVGEEHHLFRLKDPRDACNLG
jgi:hypothetical protein